MKAPFRPLPLTALAVVAAVGMAVPVLAQPNAPGGNSAGQGSSATERARGAKAPAAESYTERQLARLHRQLRISQPQEAAWNQFADATRSAAQHLQQLYQQRAANFEGMNALEDLKNYQQIVAAHAADLGKKVTTFAALYDILSPEQKQTADRISRYQEQRRQQRRMARTRRFRQGAGQSGGAPAGQNAEVPTPQAQ